MQVAIVSHFPPPPGGMPGQAELLSDKLGSEGLRVVRVRTNLGRGRLARRLDAIRGVRTLLRWPLFLVRLLIALPRVEVVHVFSHSGLGFFLFTGPSVFLGRWFGRRVVVNYHGGAAREFLAARTDSAGRILGRADAIVVPSAFLQQVFSEFGFRTEVVPNICDLDLFGREDDPPVEPVFLVSRHLEPEYDVACVLRAFRRIRDARTDARLVVLGDGSQRAALHDLAAKLGVDDAVEFTGYVAYDELPAYYRRASVFLNASRVDNQPISILEAFAARLPVITSRAGGIPYLVRDRENGLLADPGDDEGLAQAALEVIRDPALVARLRANALATIEPFRWSRVRQGWSDVYADR